MIGGDGEDQGWLDDEVWLLFVFKLDPMYRFLKNFREIPELNFVDGVQIGVGVVVSAKGVLDSW